MEAILEYQFKNPEYVLIALMSKRALTEYTLGPKRKFISDAFLQKIEGKIECFSTLGDAVISAVVCGAHFLKADTCTRHSMTQAKVKFTTNTRWEFLMKHYSIDRLIVNWPFEDSIQSLLRLIMESLCAVILLDSASLVEAAKVIGKLITPEDFSPERYGSCRIEIHRLFLDLGAQYSFQDVPKDEDSLSPFHTQELIINGEVVGVGVAENKETAQEDAAHDFVISGGLDDFLRNFKEGRSSTRSISKEKRRGESTKEDYYTRLVKFLKTTHTGLKKKVTVVSFILKNGDANNNSNSRLLCFITHKGRVISAYVSESKKDGIVGCLKRLYGYLSRGEECRAAHENEPILRHQVVESVLMAAGSLTNISVAQWEDVDHNIFDRRATNEEPVNQVITID